MAKLTTRAEHPLSTVITHWIHIVALFVLIFTGFWIHDPFTSWSFHTVRYVHLFAAFFLVGTGVFRVYWGFFGQGSADVGRPLAEEPPVDAEDARADQEEGCEQVHVAHRVERPGRERVVDPEPREDEDEQGDDVDPVRDDRAERVLGACGEFGHGSSPALSARGT